MAEQTPDAMVILMQIQAQLDAVEHAVCLHEPGASVTPAIAGPLARAREAIGDLAAVCVGGVYG